MCNLSQGIENRALARGREKGREDEKKAIARKLQKKNMPIEEIAQFVERDVEIVRQWLSEESPG